MLIIRERISGAVIAAGSEAEGSVRILEDCWYFTPENVDMTYLTRTQRTYNCPYKGVCYWIDLEAPGNKAKNIGFIYPEPLHGYEFIRGRIAFYGRETSATIAMIEE